MVHAFVCSRIDYCNSLLIGLPKLHLAPLQSVSLLNAAARLIARLPRFSHISTFMTEHLHWLSFTARIQFKILFLTCKTFFGSSSTLPLWSYHTAYLSYIWTSSPLFRPSWPYSSLVSDCHNTVSGLCLCWPFAVELSSCYNSCCEVI